MSTALHLDETAPLVKTHMKLLLLIKTIFRYLFQNMTSEYDVNELISVILQKLQ